MALNTVSIAAPGWYTLESQKDDPDPAQFLLKGLNGYQKSHIHGEILHDLGRGTLQYTHRGLIFILSAGLSGWCNINHDGKPIEFSADMVVNMEILDINIQVELVQEILLRSDLLEEERKNSSSQPKSEETGKTTSAKPAKKDTVTKTDQSSDQTKTETRPGL